MASPDPHPRGLLAPRPLLALALGACLLAYIATWRFDFVYDDHRVIENNPYLRTWDHLGRYFRLQTWANTAAADQPSQYYRPMFLLWLRANHALFGSQASYWHLSSVLLHLLASVLAYHATVKLLEFFWEQSAGRRSIAALAALVFALHPVHAEPVAWISASSELLMAIFLLGAFIAYVKSHHRSERLRWVTASSLFFLCALLAKETAVSFAPVVLVSGMVRARKLLRQEGKPVPVWRMLAYAAPWFAVLTAYLLLRWAVLGQLRPSPDPYVSLATVLASAPALLWFYCRQLVWPYPLSVLYDAAPVHSALSLEFVAAMLGLAGVAGVVWLLARRSAAIGIAALWFVLLLAPVLNVALLRTDALVQDRYLYAPSFGFCVVAGIVLFHATEALRLVPAVRLASVALLVISMAAATTREVAAWENDLLLFEDAVAVAPGNAYAKTQLGTEVMVRGDERRALELLHAAYALDVHSWFAAFDLGYLYYQRGQLPQAERFFRRAIEIRGDNRDQHLLLGIIQRRQGKLQQAETTLRQLASSWPEGRFVHLSLAEVLAEQGRYDDALSALAAESDRSAAQTASARIEARKETAGRASKSRR